MLQDLKFAARTFRKSPGFTLIAVATLALGVGASTAVFGVVDAVLLKPLPYPEAERIVFPWRLAPPQLNLGYPYVPWGLDAFHLFERESKVFESLGAFKSDSFNLSGSGEPMVIPGMRASAGFLPALGVAPSLGRFFTREEDRPGSEHEVVLGDRLWREQFRGDPNILGRAVRLNSQNYIVVGIMPAGFAFPRGAE